MSLTKTRIEGKTELPTMVVYLIRNKTNGKGYVGVTTQKLARRWSAHVSEVSKKCNRALTRAIRKYGKEGFTIEEIATTNDIDVLKDLEKHFISVLRTRVPNGYNMTEGGDGTVGFAHSDEAKKKISMRAKGRAMSDDTKSKLSKAHKGKKLSIEHRKKMSEAKTGVKVQRTREHNQAISAAKKGYTHTQHTKTLLSILKKGKPWTPARRAAHVRKTSNETNPLLQ